MDIKQALGMGSNKKVRYAFVALGDIAQEGMLPGVKHTGNSEVTALVTSDPEKAQIIGKKYDVEQSYHYAQFGDMLRSGHVDAIYLSTPNWKHAEFVLPALRAGIHVLVEKPLETSTAKCKEIVAAQKASTALLMVAYRLHFEPGTLALIEQIRSGELGEVHLFTSTFTQMVSLDNHRAHSGDAAGPVLDMGPYPVNAARYVFGAEPTEVISAVGTRHPVSGLGNFDDTVAVTLRFPENRIAQFVISYYGNSVQSYHVVGTKGQVRMDPGYSHGKSIERMSTIGQDETSDKFKNTDQFGGELKYFSDCILNGQQPEPDAEEGYADVRVLEGILAALKSGTSQTLEPFARTKRINPSVQRQTLAAQKIPDLVNASNPIQGVQKNDKN